MFKILEKYHQILLRENMKARNQPQSNRVFFTRVKCLGHIEGSTITPLKSRIEAIIKLQPPSNKKKIQEFLGVLNFLGLYVCKGNFIYYQFIIFSDKSILNGQQIWRTYKLFSLNKYQIPSQIQINHFMLCATPSISESAQLYYKHIKEQTKWTLFQQTQDYLHKPKLASLHSWKKAQL